MSQIDEIERRIVAALDPDAQACWPFAKAGDAKRTSVVCLLAPDDIAGDLVRFFVATRAPKEQLRLVLRTLWPLRSREIEAAAGGRQGVIAWLDRAEFPIKLSGPTTIWRGAAGVDAATAARGLSWSTSRRHAAFFAMGRSQAGFGLLPPIVVSARVSPADICYQADYYGLTEVVPRRPPTGVTVDTQPQAWPRLAEEHVRHAEEAERRRLAALPKRSGAGVLLIAPDAAGVDCILIGRRRYGEPRGAWSIPFGEWDAADGADPRTTAVREISEECGTCTMVETAVRKFLTDRPPPISTLSAPGLAGGQTYMIALPGIPRGFPDPRKTRAEFQEVRWSRLDDLPGNLHPGLRAAIDRLRTMRPRAPAPRQHVLSQSTRQPRPALTSLLAPDIMAR